MNAPSPRVDRTAPRKARSGRGRPASDSASVGASDGPLSGPDRRQAIQRPSSTRKYTPTIAITATADGRSRPATTAEAPAQTGRRRMRQSSVAAAAAVNRPSGYPMVSVSEAGAMPHSAERAIPVPRPYQALPTAKIAHTASSPPSQETMISASRNESRPVLPIPRTSHGNSGKYARLLARIFPSGLTLGYTYPPSASRRYHPASHRRVVASTLPAWG